MAVVWNKTDPGRSLTKFLNNFIDDPFWPIHTLAEGLDLKVLGPVFGAITALGASFGIEMSLMDKWKDSFGWGGYKVGFDSSAFYGWSLIFAIVIAVVFLILGKAANPPKNKPGAEKFVMLTVSTVPLLWFGPGFWGVITTGLMLAGGSVLLMVISWRSWTMGGGRRSFTPVAAVVGPLVAMLAGLWLTSLLGSWVALYPSIQRTSAAGSLIPRFDEGAATAAAQASATDRAIMVATRTAAWCERYCTPRAQTLTAVWERSGSRNTVKPTPTPSRTPSLVTTAPTPTRSLSRSPTSVNK